MDELIGRVTQNAHISNDQAKQAIEAVMGFLKDKLPPGVANEVNGVLNGKQFDQAALTGALNSLGGMFGGKK